MADHLSAVVPPFDAGRKWYFGTDVFFRALGKRHAHDQGDRRDENDQTF